MRSLALRLRRRRRCATGSPTRSRASAAAATPPPWRRAAPPSAARAPPWLPRSMPFWFCPVVALSRPPLWVGLGGSGWTPRRAQCHCSTAQLMQQAVLAQTSLGPQALARGQVLLNRAWDF
eukprot:gene5855-biopygen2797